MGRILRPPSLDSDIDVPLTRFVRPWFTTDWQWNAWEKPLVGSQDCCLKFQILLQELLLCEAGTPGFLNVARFVCNNQDSSSRFDTLLGLACRPEEGTMKAFLCLCGLAELEKRP